MKNSNKVIVGIVAAVVLVLGYVALVGMDKEVVVDTATSTPTVIVD